jgi:FtsP/CotA-like multicopper oxidase with cupredoxin domain
MTMTRMIWKLGPAAVLTAVLLWGFTGPAEAAIEGITGVDAGGGVVQFNLTARCDFISTPDGNSVLIWGYSDDANPLQRAQYPGPTLIVNEGDVVEITLTNWITDETGALIGVNTSMVFPGHSVAATGGEQGLLGREAAPGGTVSYTFTASHPGTFLYHSGTRADLQIELGLLGALIVRPSGGLPAEPVVDPGTGRVTSRGHAYNDSDTAFDREHLYLLTEMDPDVHDLVEFGQMDQIDGTTYRPVYWFVNGRAAPDTLSAPNVPWLPTQPYNALTRMLPGERVLMRVVGLSRDLHPFHHHGNHARVVGTDGRLLQSPTTASGADLSYEVFTIQSVPGETVDAIFTWSDKDMNWDIYGHTGGELHGAYAGAGVGTEICAGYVPGNEATYFDPYNYEWCPNHKDGLCPGDPPVAGCPKPLPVVLPENQDLAFGGFWSGSPFLGAEGGLPPGEGGLNPNAGFFFMWHSHTEKELVNFDIFPGGMLTMMVVEPPGTTDIP